MDEKLHGRRVAILATDGFEQSELVSPLQALRAAGADVRVVAPGSAPIQGMHHQEKGEMIAVDQTLAEADPQAFDALVLPGGVANPDTLRTDPSAIGFVRHFVTERKPIGAICHGPWSLVEVDGALHDRTVTSWPSLRTDITNAGGNWVDREVVVDGNLITSRRPDDLPAFNAELIRQFAKSPVA